MPSREHRHKRFLADEHELQVVKRGSPRADDGKIQTIVPEVLDEPAIAPRGD
jgi:hypothetical protein